MLCALIVLAMALGGLMSWLLRPVAADASKAAAADIATIMQLRTELTDTRRRCMECEAQNTRLRYELNTHLAFPGGTTRHADSTVREKTRPGTPV